MSRRRSSRTRLGSNVNESVLTRVICNSVGCLFESVMVVNNFFATLSGGNAEESVVEDSALAAAERMTRTSFRNLGTKDIGYAVSQNFTHGQQQEGGAWHRLVYRKRGPPANNLNASKRHADSERSVGAEVSSDDTTSDTCDECGVDAEGSDEEAGVEESVSYTNGLWPIRHCAWEWVSGFWMFLGMSGKPSRTDSRWQF